MAWPAIAPTAIGILLGISSLHSPAALAASEECRVVRNAVAQSSEAQRARMRQVLQTNDGREVQREWRMIGNRHYHKVDNAAWRSDPRKHDWMDLRDGEISDCKRTGGESIDGVSATVWSYSRDGKTGSGTVKMWIDNEAGRVLRTEIDFSPGQAKYRKSISRFDYGNGISAPE
jgi:hypothetical protein